MASHRSTALMLTAAFVGAWVLTCGWGSRAAAGQLLIDALVWGAEREIDTTACSAPLRAEIEALRRRFLAHQSRRPKPLDRPGLASMVYEAEVRYERRLVAVSTAPEAPELALAYVSDLRPCYEWEGLPTCPEREARFAAASQAAHPGGPFSQYLPLLEAHRWLCTAEAYDHEKSQVEASRARQLYETALATARQSASLLVRTAAQELAARDRCFAEQ